MKVVKHFKEHLTTKAKSMKKTADKGLEAADADMVEDGEDSSGFEDVSDEEEATQEDVKKTKKAKK